MSVTQTDWPRLAVTAAISAGGMRTNTRLCRTLLETVEIANGPVLTNVWLGGFEVGLFAIENLRLIQTAPLLAPRISEMA